MSWILSPVSHEEKFGFVSVLCHIKSLILIKVRACSELPYVSIIAQQHYFDKPLSQKFLMGLFSPKGVF